MNSKTPIQDEFLARLQQERRPATVVMANGYQMAVRIVSSDQFTLLVEDKTGKQSLLYKSAVSTITRAGGGS